MSKANPTAGVSRVCYDFPGRRPQVTASLLKVLLKPQPQPKPLRYFEKGAAVG